MKKQYESTIFENAEIAFESKDDRSLKKSYSLFRKVSNSSLVSLGTFALGIAEKIHFPVRFFVKDFFYHFCGGEDMKEALKAVEDIAQYDVMSLMDYGVEGKETVRDFDETVVKIKDAIKYASTSDPVLGVTSKITSLCQNQLLKDIGNKKSFSKKELKKIERLKERLHEMCSCAEEWKVPLYFDAEESWYQDAMDQLIMEMMAKYNKHEPIVYNTIQLYRHDRLAYLKECHKIALKGKFFLGVKLVRGAYMEKENLRAKEKKVKTPIQPTKKATDQDFDAAVLYCLEHLKEIAFCCASHNQDSILLLMNTMLAKGIDPAHPHVLSSQLLGMSDNISFNMAKMGFRCAKYIPYGPIKSVLPYLARRAKENTSVQGQMGRELSLLQKEMKRRGLIKG